MPSRRAQVGHGLAKVLGIKLDYRQEMAAEKITRGESVFSVSSADTFVEAEPTVWEWFRDVTPSGSDMVTYGRNLFPFTRWIGRYNLQWFYGDLVAGITIGAVVVPQGMAYAKLAALPVEYGLYSSFMGVLLYWFFATSKDITIGVRPTSFILETLLAYIIYSLSPLCLLSSETSYLKLKKPIHSTRVMSSRLRFRSSSVPSSVSSALYASAGLSISSLLLVSRH